MPLHTRMVLGGVLGIALGILAHLAAAGEPWLETFVRNVTQPIGQVFLRLLFMLVIPLLFSALVLGVTGLGDLSRLGRVGWKTLVCTVLLSSSAVLIGIALVNLLRPGEGMSPESRAAILEGAAERASTLAQAPAPRSGLDLIVQIVPQNPIQAAASGDMLAVMFFALLFGIGLALARTDASRFLEQGIEGLYDVTMRLIGLVISVAPFGVAALLFSLTALLGYTILVQLARFVGVVLLGLALQQFVVYPLAIRLFARRSPRAFFRGVEEAMITAFSTASSNATLPTSLKVAEENLRLPSHVARFVLTIGSTANQNGTALYEGVTVLFLAQFYGVDLSLGSQILVVGVCILGGIGTAGVPAGSLPVIAMILGMTGVPMEGIGLILGVDRFLDMCRTTLNVTGDLAAAAIIARGESPEPA